MMKKTLKRRIVVLFSLGLFSALFITTSVFTIELQHRYKELLIHVGQNAADRLSYKTEKLIRLGLIPEEFTGYQALLEETLHAEEGILYVALVNTKNKAFFEAGKRPENFSEPDQWIKNKTTDGFNIFSDINPSILSIAIVLDQNEVSSKTLHFIQTTLIYASIIALLLIAILIKYLNIHLGKPVKKLVQQIQQTNFNNADTFKHDYLTRSDEIGVIARAFSELIQKFIQSKRSLAKSNFELQSLTEELEIRVAKRTKEVEAMNEKLKSIAHLDSLTGLMNRFSFDLDLQMCFENAKKHQLEFIILLADLDGFKDVNDTFGHSAGDFALTTIGERIRQSFTYGHCVYRIGGDEFVALISANLEQIELINLILQLRDTIKEPIYYEEEKLPFDVSIGAVTTKTHNECNATQLLMHADKAMYEAKKRSIDYFIK